ncbi:MAG: PCMD domain-containing protein [Bacteroidales bacterium]|nr:PCMD domain-containing protein [Bacteroidales bacterium]
MIAVFAVSILFSSCKKEEEEKESPPAVPVVSDPLHVYGDYFYVNWIGVVGATGYYVDVATDQNFSNFLPDYTNKEVAINGMFVVEGLTPSTSYFVRMRAINAHGSSGNSVAQQFITRAANVLPNMDLEEWITYPNYENPAPEGVWASANKVVDLLPGVYPVLLFKSEDSYSGTYAAKARTDSASGMPLLTGSLSTGLFNVNLQNPLKSLITGVPYKSRPVKFQGYYKYLGVGGDSCEIRTTLSKWNPATKERDVIGEVVYRTTDLVDVYTFFDLEVVYFSAEEPDTIDVVFAASAGGEYFKGKIGSTIFVDDFNLIFE